MYFDIRYSNKFIDRFVIEMGNWASQHAKLIRSRTTLSDNSRKTRRDTEEIHKSKSFNELNRRSSVRNGHTRAITRSSSNARSLVVG